jgi:photosystem II stability/assembly factor-like uncharacterized protein
MGYLGGIVGRLIAAVTLSLLVVGAAPVQGTEAKPEDGSVIALAYDSQSETLLKAHTRALYRSADGGGSWQKIVIAPMEDGQIYSLAASPARKDVNRDVIAIAAHSTQADTVYVVVKDQGVYRSQDAGKTWRLMEGRVQDGLRQLIHSDMPGSMESGWLFAAAAKGVRRAMDCFCLWQDAGNLQSEAYSVAYDPREPKHLYAATEKGLLRSMDGGENWTQIATLRSKVISLAFTRSGTLYAVDETGALYRSVDQGGTWREVNA